MYISTFEKLRAPPPEASLRRFFGASAPANFKLIRRKYYPMRRKTPCFSYGDIRRVHRIYASN